MIKMDELIERFEAMVEAMSQDELATSARQAYEDSIDSYILDEKE